MSTAQSVGHLVPTQISEPDAATKTLTNVDLDKDDSLDVLSLPRHLLVKIISWLNSKMFAFHV